MNPDVRKKVLKSLTYGLHVLAACVDGEIAAGTVTWLSQASFQPPLVMVGIKADSRLHALIERSRQFAVNVVDSEHASMAAAFFRPTTIEGNRLNGFAFEPGPQTGAPLLIDLPVWFEASVLESVKRGDHTVFVAEILSGGVRDESAQPLALRATNWSYGG
ncbi:MAG: flavin reductase family protein [Cyanobacteria bacterium REEB65]|nr:flavin reductase family protein [Cyanobacteria bacterium REEB65]